MSLLRSLHKFSKCLELLGIICWGEDISYEKTRMILKHPKLQLTYLPNIYTELLLVKGIFFPKTRLTLNQHHNDTSHEKKSSLLHTMRKIYIKINPSRLDPGRREKTNFNFYFHTFLCIKI